MDLLKIKDLLALGSSNILASAILGIFWLYLASLLEKSEYGELGFFMSVVNVGAAIALLGTRQTVVVYEPKNRNVFYPSFIIVLISSNVTALVSYIIFQNIFVSFLIIGVAIFGLLISGIQAKQRYLAVSKYTLLRTPIIVALALTFYYLLGMNGILLGYFIASLFILKELSYLIKNKKIEFSSLKQKFSFMIHSYATRLSEVLFAWGDKIIIGILFGFILLGDFYFAFQYFALILAIPRAVGQYLVPQESQGKKNKKIKQFSIVIACGVALLSIVLVPDGVRMFIPKYEDAILPIQIMSISIIPAVISSIQQSEFAGKENSKVILIGQIIKSGIYIALIIVLGINFGIIGLAIGVLISNIAQVMYNLFVNKTQYKVQGVD